MNERNIAPYADDAVAEISSVHGHQIGEAYRALIFINDSLDQMEGPNRFLGSTSSKLGDMPWLRLSVRLNMLQVGFAIRGELARYNETVPTRIQEELPIKPEELEQKLKRINDYIFQKN